MTVSKEVDSINSQHSETTLLQLQTTPLDTVLYPAGRSFLTSDVASSAQFFIDNFRAKPVKQNITENLACAEAMTVEWGNGYLYTFVKDKVLPHGQISSDMFIESFSKQWQGMKDYNNEYSRWADNHDGVIFDDDTMQYFDTLGFSRGTDIVQRGQVFVRMQVPSTAWLVEVSGDPIYSIVDEVFESRPDRFFEAQSDVASCRELRESGEGRLSPLFWWKATMASADPKTAGAFAVKYLFGTEIESAYPHGGNCTLAVWIQLPPPLFQLHFVHTGAHYTPHPDIVDWVQQQESIRDLESGIFDQYMHNSLILWTNSLDPFVQQLQADGQPFLTLKKDNFFSLFVSVPKNSLVFQIRSTHLTLKPSGIFDACGARQYG